jgi:CspA family cold shock protein
MAMDPFASDRSVSSFSVPTDPPVLSVQAPSVKLDLQEVEGVVKWFDPRKGFGFIIGPEGQDIFAHFSTIEGDGFRVLKDGCRVVYDAIKTDKGWKAARVRRVDLEVVVPAKRLYTRTPRR